MPIGDGDRLLCLVTPHTDKHKRPIHTYTHTPCAAPRIYKILSLFIPNKIQEYYNKREDHGDIGTDINETGMQGQRMKQGEKGQMEGCWRCDGNRIDFEAEKV